MSYVNAPQLAEARGLDVQESRTAVAHDYLNLITLAGDVHAPSPAQVTRAFASTPDGQALLVAITRGDIHFLTTLER